MIDIKGYEGIYAVTSCGRIWSYKNQKFLKPNTDKYGYLYVVLCVKQKRKTYKIHRLVAQAYIENPNELPQVNHKDEIKTHNYISNLEWVDGKYNSNYGTRNTRIGLKNIGKTDGDKHPTSKQVICIETGIIYGSIREASRECNVDYSCIAKCCKGEKEKAKGFHWMYYTDYLRIK